MALTSALEAVLTGRRAYAALSPLRPIEDHGIIGDLHTVALVGKDASIA